MNVSIHHVAKKMLSTLLLALLLSLPTAFAQTAQDIQALQDQIDALNTQLQTLKAQQESAATKVSVPQDPAGNDMRIHWKEGLRLDSHNGDFKLKFGGRLQNDFAWFSEGDDMKAAGIDSQNGTEFRRARLYFGGTIYQNFEFKGQYDFAGGDADFKEVYLGAKNLPVVGRLRIGHLKEAFGLENYTSDTNHAFMENSLVNTFSPGYNIGVAIENTAFDARLAYTLGLYKETTSSNEVAAEDSSGYNITGRVTTLPIWEEGERYLHLGIAVSQKELGGNDYAPKTNAAAHLGNKLSGLLGTPTISNDPIASDSVTLLGLETAYVHGAFHAQAEYQSVSIHGDTGIEDATFNGYYAQAGYLLTGEHKAYKTSSGKFDKIRPENNFAWGEHSGLGAWELIVRYSALDMEDSGYEGGELTDYTLGLNWYLNPNMKMMMNYIHGELEEGLLGNGGKDDLDYLQARFQVTW